VNTELKDVAKIQKII